MRRAPEACAGRNHKRDVKLVHLSNAIHRNLMWDGRRFTSFNSVICTMSWKINRAGWFSLCTCQHWYFCYWTLYCKYTLGLEFTHSLAIRDVDEFVSSSVLEKWQHWITNVAMPLEHRNQTSPLHKLIPPPPLSLVSLKVLFSVSGTDGVLGLCRCRLRLA